MEEEVVTGLGDFLVGSMDLLAGNLEFDLADILGGAGGTGGQGGGLGGLGIPGLEGI